MIRINRPTQRRASLAIVVSQKKILVYFLNNWKFAECIMDGCMAMRLRGPLQQAPENWEHSIALRHRTESLTALRHPCLQSRKHGFLLIILKSSSWTVLSILEHRVYFSHLPLFLPDRESTPWVCLSSEFFLHPLPPPVCSWEGDRWQAHCLLPRRPSSSGRNLIMSLTVKTFQGHNSQLLLSTYSECIELYPSPKFIDNPQYECVCVGGKWSLGII